MKILISSPLNSKDQSYKKFVEKFSLLKKSGHNLNDTATEKISAKSQEKIEKLIKETDILVVECSLSDFKSGFEIARALDEKKIVILFSLEKIDSSSITNQFSGNKSVVSVVYTAKNLEAKILESLKVATSKLDSKFILILPAEMERYLDWSSQHKRMHKAQIVRGAIEQLIKKDRDYKEFRGE